MSKSRDLGKKAVDRRSFLRGFGLTAGAAAAGVAALTPGAVAAKTQAMADETARTGYRETEHVRRVYDLARRF